jgi:GNAT superfamily N-acetyltransferase|uniref:GNAT family N-acetyltransferase n=1 Tax=Desulfobacca acetoxidans TaxID=60893 RepID=A0A7C3WQN8_9BACT
MIRPVKPGETGLVLEIINEAAQAYQGVIPPDCWHEPYMSEEELQREIKAGVVFWGYELDRRLVGVMGRQDRGPVVLIRHAYVHPACQRRGFGTQLLRHLTQAESKPLLVGTWAAAHWAIRFYEKHGFRLVSPEEKNHLLRTYWDIPARQVETSVVLADARWFSENRG